MQVNYTTPARTVQGTVTVPRSLEVLTEFLRAEVPCPHCEASPGTSCKWQGRRSVHLGRWVRAYAAHQITPRELETLAGLLPVVITSATIIRDAR